MNQDKYIDVIDEFLKRVEPFSKEEILADLKKAEERNEKNKKEKKDRKGKNNVGLGNFLKKHDKKKIKLDSKEDRLAYDKDICMILKSFREDFIPLLYIYNFLDNQGQCNVLKKHFYLKGNVEDESTNDEIVEIPDEPVITINAETIDNDYIYYSNIVKGVLNMINTSFDTTYMKHHLISGFLLEFNEYKYYQSNPDKLKKLLAELIEDIDRILENDKLEKNKLIGTKIKKEDFISIIQKACLEEDDEDLLIQIYKQSSSNDCLVSKIKGLQGRKYQRIITYYNEYLEITELKKTINTQNVQMEKQKKDYLEKMEKQKKENQEQIEKLEKNIEKLEKNIEKLEKNNEKLEKNNAKLEKENQEQNVQINKLNEDKKVQSDQIKTQDGNINQLRNKVDFLEIILNALITRKVINHSINQFLIKYKNSLEITKISKEKNGKMTIIPYIKVKNDINGVPFKSCQNLIDLLFDKKDKCNDCVHFNDFKKPTFVGDIWETVIDFIKLTEEEKDIFNKIFTDDIKKSFKFSQKDVKIEL